MERSQRQRPEKGRERKRHEKIYRVTSNNNNIGLCHSLQSINMSMSRESFFINVRKKNTYLFKHVKCVYFANMCKNFQHFFLALCVSSQGNLLFLPLTHSSLSTLIFCNNSYIFQLPAFSSSFLVLFRFLYISHKRVTFIFFHRLSFRSSIRPSVSLYFTLQLSLSLSRLQLSLSLSSHLFSTLQCRIHSS